MIYISAQPAEYYFLWQLEIQLQNFEDIGIPQKMIQVILAYNPAEGIPPVFEDFTKKNNQAYFFFYPDTRNDPQYLSSVRPHILEQHFKQFPELENEVIFYHDSDIFFRSRLDETILSQTDYWYFSDARNYVSSTYLKNFGHKFFFDICRLVDIDSKFVEDNDKNSGGAQHVMKGVNASFWKNVEMDSEKLYIFLKEFNTGREKDAKDVQAWCADMWAVLWNAWKMKKEVIIHDELNFSWPKDHISNFYQCKIFHNSGVFTQDKYDYFCKLLFKKNNPYDVDFSTVKSDSCSIKFVELIQNLANKQLKINISDCTLVISATSLSYQQQERLIQYLNYLYKHIQIQVHVLETGSYSTMDIKAISKKAKYFLQENSLVSQHLHQKIKSKYFIYMDSNILLPVENICSSVNLLREKGKKLVLPMNEIMAMTQPRYVLFRFTLSLFLDEEHENHPSEFLDYIECFAMSKNDYIKSGGNNEEWHFYTEDGFNLERLTRCRLLGYTIQKVELPAFKWFKNGNRNNFEKRNIEKKYLSLCEETFETLKRKIACRYYSFDKRYSKKTDLKKIKIGINATKANVDISSIQKDLTQEQVGINLLKLKSNIGQSYHENFISVINQAKKDKLDFLILVSENIVIVSQENIEIFWRAIEDMNYYGIQLLSALNDGAFTHEKKLNKQLLWIDTMPESAVFVVHKSLFEKILKHTFETDKSLERNLTVLTDHVGVTSSFIGLPDIPHDIDEKNDMAYRDRLTSIAKVGNKLAWISGNRIN